MELHNEMEAIVFGKIDEVLQRYPDVCTCEKCRLDIAALTLNSLPPHYTVSLKGQIYTRINVLDQQFGTDVVTAIAKAVEKVSARPQHDEKIK